MFTDSLEFLDRKDLDMKYELGSQKVMINVGSVGQPRNSDARSSYVTVDGNDVVFHRVDYDIDKTANKIYDIPELDNFLGDRLREGR